MTITPTATHGPHSYTDVDHTTFGQNSVTIETLYHSGRPLQWAREFGFNSIEAGATLVSYTVDFVTARERGIYRRMIADNGCGMTRPELSAFINQIGGGKSKRSAGASDNLGQGAKVASAYFNPAGVVYLTRTVEDGDAMCIYVRDNKSGDYGLLRTYGVNDDEDVVRRSIHRPQRLFLDEDGTDPFDAGTDWEAVMDEAFENMGNPETGTAVIFMGATGTEDTINGDPHRPAEGAKYALYKYLTTRIWEIPEDVTMRVIDFRRSYDRSEWPISEQDDTILTGDADRPEEDDEADILPATGKGRLRFEWYAIKGLKNILHRPVHTEAAGSVEVVSGDGVPARIDWIITNQRTVTKYGKPRKGKTNSSTLPNPGGVGIVMAVSAAAKRGVYDVMDFVSDGDANPWLRSFGIDVGDVQDKIWLTITPQVARFPDRESGEGMVPGIHMDGSRSHLVGTSASRQSEPLESYIREWGRDFQSDEKFPAEIQALLDAVWVRKSTEASALDEKTTARIAEMLKGVLTREVAIVGGKKPTAKTEGRSGFRSPRKGRKTGVKTPGDRLAGGKRAGGAVSATGTDATVVKISAALPEVVWVPADNPAWQDAESKGAIAMLRLPGEKGVPEEGAVWLRGHAPDMALADRKRDNGDAYAAPFDWRDGEHSTIRAAVEDTFTAGKYSKSQYIAVEAAVKRAYAASAQSVAAHLIASGGWNPTTKTWDPKDGVPENYESAVKPFNFSNAVRGYYPQKQIAAGFLGSIARFVRKAS